MGWMVTLLLLQLVTSRKRIFEMKEEKNVEENFYSI